jgi:hypothetical protein
MSLASGKTFRHVTSLETPLDTENRLLKRRPTKWWLRFDVSQSLLPGETPPPPHFFTPDRTFSWDCVRPVSQMPHDVIQVHKSREVYSYLARTQPEFVSYTEAFKYRLAAVFGCVPAHLKDRSPVAMHQWATSRVEDKVWITTFIWW